MVLVRGLSLQAFVKSGVVNWLSLVFELALKVGQNELAVAIRLIPLPEKLLQDRDSGKLSNNLSKIIMNVGSK